MFDSVFYLQPVQILHLEVKFFFFSFSNFRTSTFLKLKRNSEFCKCNSHLAVFDYNDYCIFSALHTDTDKKSLSGGMCLVISMVPKPARGSQVLPGRSSCAPQKN